MTREEINEELRVLNEDQLRQSSIIKTSDVHACKCTKTGVSFQETYPEEFAEYSAALDKFHKNEARIAELNAIEPDEQEFTELIE